MGYLKVLNAFVKRKEIHLDEELYCLLLCVCGFNKLIVKSVIRIDRYYLYE